MTRKSIGIRPKGSMKYLGGLSTLFSFSEVLQRDPRNVYVNTRNMSSFKQPDSSPVTDYGQTIGYVTNLINGQLVPLVTPITYLPTPTALLANFGALVVAANTPTHLFVDSDIGVVHQQVISEEDLSLDFQVTLQQDNRNIYLFGKYSTREIEQIKNILSLDKGYLVPEFSPKHLFLNGEHGFWLDPSDLSTMFQDAAGTVPVTALGQTVGLVKDKSGNGIDAYQVNTAKQPILRFNEVTNKYYLEFDGIDDFLTIDLPEIITDSVFFAAKVRRLRLDKTYEYIFSNSAATEAGRFSARLTSAPNSANASAKLGLQLASNLYTSILSDVKSSELSFIASASRADKLALYTDNSYFEKPQANTVLPTKILSPIVIGKASPTSNLWAANMRISELIVVFDAVSDDEITKIVEYLRA